MDFIGGLPISNGFDSILVVVDRFSKMTHLILCMKTLNAEGLCDLVVHNVVRYHGFPDSVVSDRGPQFVSQFWNSILRFFGMRKYLTAGAHPEGNGQVGFSGFRRLNRGHGNGHQELAGVKDIQSFLGFVKFYRKFIRFFAFISVPLVELTKKSVEWEWSRSYMEVFVRPDFNLPFVLMRRISRLGLLRVNRHPLTRRSRWV